MLTILELPTTQLIDQNGRNVNISEYNGLIILVNFWSTECPFSEQTDAELRAIRSKHPDVAMIAVLSNQNEDPKIAKNIFPARGYDQLWVDQNAVFAHACGAETTPTALLFDMAGTLRYQGAINDLTFRKRVSEVNYIQNALEQLKAGVPIAPAKTPAYGCAIVDYSLDE